MGHSVDLQLGSGGCWQPWRRVQESDNAILVHAASFSTEGFTGRLQSHFKRRDRVIQGLFVYARRLTYVSMFCVVPVIRCLTPNAIQKELEERALRGF